MSEQNPQQPYKDRSRNERGSDYWAFGPLSNPPLPGTVQAIIRERLEGFVQRQMSRLDEMLDVSAVETATKEVKNQKPGAPPISAEAKRFLDVTMLALGVLQSARVVARLCEDRDIDSGYVLARTMVERAVNFAYLAFADDEAYTDWMDYSLQKAFRLLNRGRQAGSTEFHFGVNPAPDLSQFPELQQILKRFTGSKGRPKTRWTQLSLDDRLAAIEGKFEGSKMVVGLLLQALVHTYELGAEAQHGTLLGVGLNYGLLATADETLNKHVNIVLTSTSLCLLSTAIVLAHLSANLK